MSLFEASFLEDMRDAYMMEAVTGQGYGNTIDKLVEDVVSRTGLFESKEEKQWKDALSGVNNELDSEHADTLDDGDMIDSLINK